MITLFLKALAIGFAMATPVGPIGALCIQRSLQNGFKAGAMTGLGAASANSIYGFMAGFSLITISSIFLNYGYCIQILGGAFMLYLGIKMIFRSVKTSSEAIPQSDQNFLHIFGSAFLFTLIANPTQLLSIMAIFAGLDIDQSNINYTQTVILTLGIAMGSIGWWLLLSRLVTSIPRQKFSDNLLKNIGCISGAITVGFGLLAVVNGIK